MTLSNYVVQDIESIEELRCRLNDVKNLEMVADTSFLMRFLKARNYDVSEAENMIRNHINWRISHKVDSILSWYTPSEVTEKYIGLGPMGFDKEGSPVNYLHFGYLDIRGLLNTIKQSEVVNFLIHRLESDLKNMKIQSEKGNSKAYKWVYVFDFDKFPLSIATHKPSIEIIGKLVTLYEANYPELLKAAIIINASWYFQVAYALIKPLLTRPTLEKIKIFGKDGWVEELLKHIHADDLPKCLGGNMTDPNGDPMCRTIIKLGGLVPEHYYAINNRSNFAVQPGVKKLIVNRLSKQQLEFQISYPDSFIEWEFETKERDIAMSLLYKEDCQSEVKEIVPKQRFCAMISSEVGIFKCDKIGLYYLEFDNSYSWIYQKEIYYKAEVIAPTDLK